MTPRRSCLAALLRLAPALLALAGCERPPQRSLVGDWPLAPDKVLLGEEIELWARSKAGQDDYARTVAFVFQPGGHLRIVHGRDHFVCCYGGVDRRETDNARTIPLAPETDLRLRRMLARLRPRVLSAEGPITLPRGCSYVYDGGARGGVAYSGKRAGGVFILQSDCGGAGADEAVQLIRDVALELPGADARAFLGALSRRRRT